MKKYVTLFFCVLWTFAMIGIVIVLGSCVKSDKVLKKQKELEEIERMELLDEIEDDLDSIPEAEEED
jgi:hypothetical protein